MGLLSEWRIRISRFDLVDFVINWTAIKKEVLMHDTHKVRHSAEKNVNQAAKAFSDAKERVYDAADEAKEKGQALYEDALDRGNDFVEGVRNHGEDTWSDVKTWVRKNPGAAIGCAVAAGFVLSALLRSDD